MRTFFSVLKYRKEDAVVHRLSFVFNQKENKGGKPMAKPYRIPDFRKLYPEASEEVIAVLITTERKI